MVVVMEMRGGRNTASVSGDEFLDVELVSNTHHFILKSLQRTLCTVALDPKTDTYLR